MTIQRTIGRYVLAVPILFLALIPLSSPVEAQLPGGGFNVAIVTYCTCGPGYLALIVGAGSTPTGLYYFGPQTQYWVGTGLPVASWLGFYTPNAGVCLMNAGIGCFSITGNLMNWYGGSN